MSSDADVSHFDADIPDEVRASVLFISPARCWLTALRARPPLSSQPLAPVRATFLRLAAGMLQTDPETPWRPDRPAALKPT